MYQRIKSSRVFRWRQQFGLPIVGAQVRGGGGGIWNQLRVALPAGGWFGGSRE